MFVDDGSQCIRPHFLQLGRPSGVDDHVVFTDQFSLCFVQHVEPAKVQTDNLHLGELANHVHHPIGRRVYGIAGLGVRPASRVYLHHHVFADLLVDRKHLWVIGEELVDHRVEFHTLDACFS